MKEKHNRSRCRGGDVNYYIVPPTSCVLSCSALHSCHSLDFNWGWVELSMTSLPNWVLPSPPANLNSSILITNSAFSWSTNKEVDVKTQKGYRVRNRWQRTSFIWPLSDNASVIAYCKELCHSASIQVHALIKNL